VKKLVSELWRPASDNYKPASDNTNRLPK
jgi:hypothetical protein